MLREEQLVFIGPGQRTRSVNSFGNGTVHFIKKRKLPLMMNVYLSHNSNMKESFEKLRLLTHYMNNVFEGDKGMFFEYIYTKLLEIVSLEAIDLLKETAWLMMFQKGHKSMEWHYLKLEKKKVQERLKNTQERNGTSLIILITIVYILTFSITGCEPLESISLLERFCNGITVGSFH